MSKVENQTSFKNSKITKSASNQVLNSGRNRYLMSLI
eukprot:UN15903